MSLTLAVDIGGTHIRVAVYEPDSTKPLPIGDHDHMRISRTYMVALSGEVVSKGKIE